MLPAVALLLAGPPVPPVSFVRDVAPVLARYCFACHGGRKPAGKYDMTRFTTLTGGGAVVPGKPDESELYTLMVTAEERRMPPRDKGAAVPTAAAVVRRWIEAGATLDAGVSPDADLGRELRARTPPPAPPASYTVPVAALAFTPDGKAVVTGGRHELLVWALPSGELLRRVRVPLGRAAALQFLPDGRLAVAGGRPGEDGGVVLVDLARPEAAARLVTTDDMVLCVALSGDGKRLAAGGTDRLARVWDVATGKLVATADGHTDWVTGVAFTADGTRLVTASRDKTAKVFDPALGETVTTFPDHRGPLAGVVVTAAGAVSAGADRELKLWPPGGDGKAVNGGHYHAAGVTRLAAHAGPKRVASASADKTVRLWDAESLARSHTLTGLTDDALAVAFSPDGRRVAAGSHAGEVRVWAVADGQPAASFRAAVK